MTKLRTKAHRFLASAPEKPEKVRAGRLFSAEATIPRPPRDLRRYETASAHFDQIALMTLGRLNMAGLRPDHDVLDIGCGIGRIARYLCDYLVDGTYEGFDVIRESIEWCTTNITSRFGNFKFQWTPLFSTKYNPDLNLPLAADFRFPYPDDSFDFVFAQSVFSHLQPDESCRYLAEIARVMRPGAVSFCTWIFYKDGSSDYQHATVSRMTRDPSGDFALADPDEPAKVVGYDEGFVLSCYRAAGLRVVNPVHPGFRMQDAIVATVAG